MEHTVDIGPSTATRYKAEQRRQWDEAACELRAWWPAFEGFMAPVIAAMLAHVRVGAGDQVVDVASGFGEPALGVAGRVGPRGRVVATDLSAAMLAVAAERARVAGRGNIEFVQMDAEDPALAEGRYAAATCRLGLMFLPSLDAALGRLVRLLAPGGRFVAAVWGSADANAWLSVAIRTLTEFLELAPPPPGAPGVFGLAGEGVLEAALGDAGLEEIDASTVALSMRWPSPAAYAAFHRASPMRRLVAGEEPERRREAWAQVKWAARRAWGPGALSLRGEVVVVSGRRAGGKTGSAPMD